MLPPLLMLPMETAPPLASEVAKPPLPALQPYHEMTLSHHIAAAAALVGAAVEITIVAEAVPGADQRRIGSQALAVVTTGVARPAAAGLRRRPG